MEPTPDYLTPYEEAVKQHGGTFESTLWRSKVGQKKRFKVFKDAIDFTSTTIVDVGCGIGDFAFYLTSCGVEFETFHGIDAMGEMIRTANVREIPRCTFSVLDVVGNTTCVPISDWIVCSGTLNAMTQEQAVRLIAELFQRCNVGIGFNFLSDQSWRDPKTEDLTPASRFQTNEILKFAFTLTPLVFFDQAYLNGHDATVIVRKQEVPQ